MIAPPIGPARLVREPLQCAADPLHVARWLRGEPRAVALSGAWAGGGVLLASHPVAVAPQDADPFALLDVQPEVLGGATATGDAAVGGGWLGWLGFGLGRALEPVPPPPPRPQPLPAFDLAFHDHVVRCDADGRWWFEALHTDARAAALAERLETWRARLAAGPPQPQPFSAGPLALAAPGAAGHATAVAEGVERIAAGEVFQVNLCLRLDGALDGELLDLWVQAAGELQPEYAAYVAAADHAVASLSPELFLRRLGPTVVSEPIKGTAPAADEPHVLATSAKDRAENVMIVDLMRNDLGRVCEYGSVTVPKLYEVRPAAGVWHLVSTVQGTLRPGATDATLTRATFPPGSVTGAPKVRALRVISELEATGREAYCGAIGICSPLGGLELNVAIRTFEARGGRLWLGAGGAVVADSDPAGEVEEALAKARGVAAAAGMRLDVTAAAPRGLAAAVVTEARPDPARGLLETLLVVDGSPMDADAHLGRLRASCSDLGLEAPGDLAEAIAVAATGVTRGRLRVVVDANGAHVSAGPLPAAGAVALSPVTLPGGLGVHKWADRALIDALSGPATTPLICDLDGDVLEAGYAAIAIVERDLLVVPPLDGRQLPSLSRERMLAGAPAAGLQVRIEPFSLQRAQVADAVLLTSTLRGPHPAALPQGPPPQAAAALAERLGAGSRVPG